MRTYYTEVAAGLRFSNQHHDMAVVALELGTISDIRYRCMDTPFLGAPSQVVAGGTLVFGILSAVHSSPFRGATSRVGCVTYLLVEMSP